MHVSLIVAAVHVLTASLFASSSGSSTPGAFIADRGTPSDASLDDGASLAGARAQREKARLQAHFATVIEELESADVTHLSDTARLSRARLVDELRLYAAKGLFPKNRGVAPHLAPIFVDDEETHCAMGHLLALTGAAPLVDEIRATQNLAYIADLASDPRLHTWLDAHGLSLFEAGRIQPGYASEEPMVAGLCVAPALFSAPMADAAILVVDVTMQKLLFHQGEDTYGPAVDHVELRIENVAAVVQPCTDALCAVLLESAAGHLYVDTVQRFVEHEPRRGIVVARLVEGSLTLDGMGAFAADAKYGDNRDGAVWFTLATGPLVHIPDDVLVMALTAGSGDACLDVLLAHDAAGLCHIGTRPSFGSPTGDSARAKCAAALDPQGDVPPPDPAIVDDETPPASDGEAAAFTSCAATKPSESIVGLLLGLALFGQRRKRGVRRVYS